MLRFNLIDIYIKFEYSLVILGYIILCYLFYLDAKNRQKEVFVTPDFGFMDHVSGKVHYHLAAFHTAFLYSVLLCFTNYCHIHIKKNHMGNILNRRYIHFFPRKSSF